ncbi:CPBP family intramembrane glutamic endopeptidase [Nocardiopsis halotolerans]|uniref:CPBP family intramembrane glutamic endopeptidase n=1 Tax=Nocardiopsis halotolerans TaxID=124252 RepID=UPI0003489BFA|nr:type II CAAX endopeptidase family protein [Nocardiopsis halotolerans]
MTDSTPSTEPAAGWRRLVTRRPLVSFFVLACGLSWIAWIPYILSDHGLGLWDFEAPNLLMSQLLLMLPGAYLGPIFSAYLVTRVVDGRKGVRRWMGRILRWRMNWRWYALALVGVPALIILCAGLFSEGDVRAPALMALAFYVPGLVLQFVTTGLAEEPGWRDFALPRIQPYFGPLLGTVVLGVVWGIWHLPLFVTEWSGYPNTAWKDPFVFTAMCVAISVVMTWVFNRTGESLPIAILMHASVNNMMSIVVFDMFPSLEQTHGYMSWVLFVGFGAIAAVLVVVTRGRLGYDSEAAVEARKPDTGRDEREPGADVRA